MPKAGWLAGWLAGSLAQYREKRGDYSGVRDERAREPSRAFSRTEQHRLLTGTGAWENKPSYGRVSERRPQLVG